MVACPPRRCRGDEVTVLTHEYLSCRTSLAIGPRAIVSARRRARMISPSSLSASLERGLGVAASRSSRSMRSRRACMRTTRCSRAREMLGEEIKCNCIVLLSLASILSSKFRVNCRAEGECWHACKRAKHSGPSLHSLNSDLDIQNIRP
jgi:hypothetical protein